MHRTWLNAVFHEEASRSAENRSHGISPSSLFLARKVYSIVKAQLRRTYVILSIEVNHEDKQPV